MAIEARILEDLTDIDPEAWDALSAYHPFVSHAFLQALIQSGSTTQAKGWQPYFLTLWQDDVLKAAMPAYLKMHSYGEYVFDWAWADAYQRNGLEYYPKWLNAAPFSPVTGPRLLAGNDAVFQEVLFKTALEHVKTLGLSSWHCLFPDPNELILLQKYPDILVRQGVQFHWRNAGYRDFAAFLESLTQSKRKKIKAERRKVVALGIECIRKTGKEITEDDWVFFYQCYSNTYFEHGSTPYLNLAFFKQIGLSMAEHLLMVIAYQDGHPVASTLNVFTSTTFYGRYWGALKAIPNLHFELCYYQTIEFCIERGIQLFEGGAQGEHKLARGFLPTMTYSAHWLADERFQHAVAEYLERESQGLEVYVHELNEHHQPYISSPDA